MSVWYCDTKLTQPGTPKVSDRSCLLDFCNCAQVEPGSQPISHLSRSSGVVRRSTKSNAPPHAFTTQTSGHLMRTHCVCYA